MLPPILSAHPFPGTARLAVVRILQLGGFLASHTTHVSGLSWSDLKRKSGDETDRNCGKKQLLEHDIPPIRMRAFALARSTVAAAETLIEVNAARRDSPWRWEAARKRRLVPIAVTQL
jgi:hypothetical protein